MSVTSDAFVKKQDEMTRENVVRQIGWSPEIFSKDITVKVVDQNVQLNGYVHTYLEKNAAERAAKSVYGVLSVANDITVKPKEVRTDPEIARDVVDALRLHSAVPEKRLKVSVHEGFVTLEGMVDFYFQRHNAEMAVQVLSGVKGVINVIAVKPTISTEKVKEKIEEAWKRTIDLDTRSMFVTAHDGAVDIHGRVHSWNEKEEAERAAWQAPGVHAVHNYLQISI